MEYIKTFDEFINEGYAPNSVTGLHNAKPGDFIEIGFEGTRYKSKSKIEKIVSNNRLQDTDGNIFDRNGIIFRKKASWVKQAGDKIVSARQITQAEYKEQILDFVNRQLREFDWKKIPIDDLIEVGKIIKRGFPQLEDIK